MQIITFLKERWSSIREAAGIRWQVFGLLISIAISRLDWIYRHLGGDGSKAMIFGFPSWILGITVALVFLFAWTLELNVKLLRQIKSSRVEISRLRREGVRLRNAGRRTIENTSLWQKWEKDVLDWNDRVISAIAQISEADSEWFAVLDIVPPPRVPPGNAPEEIREAYLKLFNEHDFRVKRLGKMIARLWGK
jgi:hypothetical protein